MMNHMFCLFIVVLFVLLTPNVLLRLPPKGGKWTVAIVHGLVFAFVLHFAYMYYFKATEGYTAKKKTKNDHGPGSPYK